MAQRKKVDWFDGKPSNDGITTATNKKIDWFDGSVANITESSSEHSNKPIDNWLNLNLDSQRGSYHSTSTLEVAEPNPPPRGDQNDKIVKQYKGFGFIKLLEISSLDPNEMFLKFNVQKKNFKCLLNEDLQSDKIVIFVKCLAKLCNIEFDKSKKNILTEVCSSNIFKTIDNYISQLPSVPFSQKRFNQYLWMDFDNFWYNLFKFMRTLLDIMPEEAVKLFPRLIETIKCALQGVEIHHKEILSPDIQELLMQLEENLIYRLEKVSLSGEPNDFESKIKPCDFLNMNIFPSMEELTGSNIPSLRPNLIDGAYCSVDDYLDVHFKLLREDFISPLREAIIDYTNDSKSCSSDNVRIYAETYLVGYGVSKEAVGLRIVIESLKNQKRTFINDDVLMYGSLFMILEKNLKKGYLLTMESRENILSGEIIGLPQGFSPDFDMFEKPYILIESKTYFLPYFFVLKSLQQSSLKSNFPMKKYFIDAKISEKPPDYVDFDTEYIHNDSTKVIKLLQKETWPDNLNDFDESQYAAFKMALTNEFLTIQGPPGTGKTYIGLKIAEAIISNKFGKPPLLILCYTNNALDQFLEKILSITNNIIRVGGQSSNIKLNAFNLKNTHKNPKFKQLKRSYFHLLESIGNICKILELLNSTRHIVDLSRFSNLIDFPLEKSLQKFGIRNHLFPILNWLLISEISNEQRTIIEEISSKNSDDLETLQCDNNYRAYDFPDYKEELRTAFFDINELQGKQNSIKTLTESFPNMSKQNFELLEEYYETLTKEITSLKTRLAHRRSKTCLSKNKPFESYMIDERWELYWSWKDDVHYKLSKTLPIMMKKYEELKIEYEEMSAMLDLQALREADVVGFTTTGAAKYNNLIKTLGSSTVIVEEAAEILESHIIAALPESCKHLILIGDHQQLRPTTASYKLSKLYKLDISLFERMVNMGRNCCRLNVQHRMRPDIAALISPSIYENLSNHSCVTKYKKIEGMQSNLFFFHHKYPESRNSVSYSNEFEARFCLRLVKYLLQQGYESKDITILSAYTGQMLHMKQMKKKDDSLKSVDITVLDNYQGEENRIIILSLVRNNREKNVGFLSISNRICVALSRAKEGMYIFGNMTHLKAGNKLWVKINSTLENCGSIGSILKLACSIHPERITEIKTDKDFDNCPNGGCDKECGAILNCGHKCKNFCHPFDKEHKSYKCEEECL